MLCVVIKGPTFEEAFFQIAEALSYADLVELRLDYFQSLDLIALKELRSQFSIPMIFTHRGQEKDIRRLAALEPEYMDIESHASPALLEEISSTYPRVNLILSYHNFEETPEELTTLYEEMQRTPAYFYKIAVTAKNSLDALRFLAWAKEAPGKLIAISMGPYGQISRILAPIFGFPITYASIDKEQMTAPGQLTAKTLLDQYHHRTLTPNTKIYGLIGNPVEQSISDVTHNDLFSTLCLDALYVKMQVTPEELPTFLHYAKKVPFQGLSVTMPLKEKILPFIDEIDPEALTIGAVNTLLFKDGKIFGCNTDGIGALNAIEQYYPVKDKRIVIIGAGGAAKAIAYEAHQRGAFITILNRTKNDALQIKGLEEMKECYKQGYEFLINCTPTQPLPSDYLLPEAIVMDIVTKPKETPLLQLAKKMGCQTIYGYDMFVEQALGQFALWFEDQIDFQKCKTIFRHQEDTACKVTINSISDICKKTN